MRAKYSACAPSPRSGGEGRGEGASPRVVAGEVIRGHRPAVIKIGGSCAFSLDLRRWSAMVAACGGRAVVVPGGGPFADAVRAAQQRMKFDDAAAHHMAMLGMEQFGHALASHD